MVSDCSVVMNDKKYFTCDGSFMLGNNHFNRDDRAECPDDARYAGTESFWKYMAVKPIHLN